MVKRRRRKMVKRRRRKMVKRRRRKMVKRRRRKMVKRRGRVLLWRLKQEEVLDTALRKKRQWLRKIEEMPKERLGKTVNEEEIREETEGGPRKRWEDDLGD